MITDGITLIARSIPPRPAVVYYESQMRRILSIFFVLLFGLGPLSAALGAEEDTRIPACCRRHGTHHCAISMGGATTTTEAASGRPIVKAPATCPLFPGYTVATASAPQALTASPLSLPSLLTQSHSPAANRAAALLSQIRTRASRGPPASSLA
jgi:hypothetical protein